MLQKGQVPGFEVEAPGLNPNVAAALDPATGSRLVLPGGNDQLTFWSRKQPAASSAYGVLDVRLELVDLEGPDWAAPPDPKAAQRGPFTPEIGSSLDDVIAQGLSSLKGTEFDDGSF